MAMKQAANSGSGGLSLRPSNATQGGGLLDDFDGLITKARWGFGYGNDSAGSDIVTLQLHIQPDDSEAEEVTYISTGKEFSKSVVPSKDGKTLMQTGSKTSPTSSSNIVLFYSSILNAGVAVGFGEDEFAAAGDGVDATFLENWYCHFQREPVKDTRTGETRKNEKGYEQTVLCVSKIISMEGKPKGGAKGKVAAGAGKPVAGKPNGAGAAAASSDIDDKATETLIGVLGAAEGGALPKVKLSQAIFAALKNDPDRNKVATYAFKDEFLGAEGKPWTYDGTTVSLG